MFERLDEDGNHSLDMKELWNLFKENGLEMTLEECAEMFSVVYEIKNAYLKSEEAKNNKLKKTKTRKKWDKEQDKLALQLNLEDFHVVTSKSRKALLKMQNDLTQVRAKMREKNKDSFVPVTVDELMY